MTDRERSAHADERTHPDEPTPLETVELDEHIEASPNEVFDYLADPARRPFGRDDFLTLGDRLAHEPPASEPGRIAWEVTVADGGERHPGTVEILVRPEGTGSRILITHRITATARPLALAA